MQVHTSSPAQVVDLVEARIARARVAIVEVVPVELCYDGRATLHAATIQSVTDLVQVLRGAHAVRRRLRRDHRARSAESGTAQHEVALLLLSLHVSNRTGQALLHSLSQVFELVQIIAHLLLTLQLSRHHASLQLLLLLEGAGLASFPRLLKEAKAV